MYDGIVSKGDVIVDSGRRFLITTLCLSASARNYVSILTGPSAAHFPDLLDHDREHLVHIADNAIGRDAEYRRIGVLVDRDNDI